MGQSGTLSAKEWCAEYRQVFVDAGFPTPGLGEGAAPLGAPSTPGATEFLSLMGKLNALADTAPAAIRDDLKAVWTVPPGALAAPASIPTNPDDAGKALAERLERPMRWITDNCGGETPSGVPPTENLQAPELSRPTGEWQPVQQGSVGDSHWTFFRTEASDGGACVSFEADPSYMDLQARMQRSAPPGMTIPRVPLPSVPGDLGLAYKGKFPQCGPKPDAFGRSDPVIFWVQDEDETNRYNVLAGLVMDSARSLTFTFKEGDQKIVKPVDGTFVATYDPKLHVAKVVPDLGPGSQVSCAPLPKDHQPPGIPDVFALACQGSVSGSRLPVPLFGQPKR
jgi:hypothetical protein